MKILLLFLFLIINQINTKIEYRQDPPDPPSSDQPGPPPGSDQPGPGPSPDQGYDYSNYKATSINTNLNDEFISNSESDSSAVYINDTGIVITNSNITKEAGTASVRDNSEFYGVNAAVLVQGGSLIMNGGIITTKVETANALVATNDGEVTIKDTEIISTGSSSSRGLHATYGGKITAENVKISSQGGSCATLATDRGEGTVSCTNCDLTTNGAGSPLIYSTGDITVTNTDGTSYGAQCVVVEGKNKATVKSSSNLKCTGKPNRGTVDQCGVMLYQSMSGDAETGISSFICDSSSLEITQGDYYTTAPFFFITNTKSEISLNKCDIKYGSKIFLSTKGTSEWGTQGSNGGEVTLTLTDQKVEGNFVLDNISTLKLVLKNSEITGTINGDNKAKYLEIVMSSDSKITLTGNSYYTTFSNDDKTGSNLINGTYSWNYEDKGNSAKSIYDFNKVLLLLGLLLSIIL